MTRPTSEAQISGMFDRIAGQYDFMNKLLSARQDRRWRKALIRCVPFRPKGRFVDVATGTADVVLAAADAHKEYDDFLGVDISSEMLRFGQQKLDASPVGSKIRLQQMSAENLDIESNSVDCLSISFGLRNVVDKENALQEFHRVLNKDGHLLILEFFIPQSGIFARLFQFYFKHILPLIGRLLSDTAAYRYLPDSVGSFYSADELQNRLYKHGFCVESSKNFLFGATRLIKARKL